MHILRILEIEQIIDKIILFISKYMSQIYNVHYSYVTFTMYTIHM